MITIREITAEEAAIQSEWVKDMPLWWQAVDRSVSRRTHGPQTKLGVFDGELVAIYTLQEIGKGIIDTHLDCKRGTKPEVIIESAKAVKQKLLSEGFTTLFLWPLKRNLALIRIAEMCGFRPTGVKMLMGKLGNRPAEWVQLGVSNE
jgi:hypothetical protein